MRLECSPPHFLLLRNVRKVDCNEMILSSMQILHRRGIHLKTLLLSVMLCMVSYILTLKINTVKKMTTYTLVTQTALNQVKMYNWIINIILHLCIDLVLEKFEMKPSLKALTQVWQ